MKQLQLAVSIFLFCSLFSFTAFSQASCTGNARSASCYAYGVNQSVSGAWQVTCPTGNFRYNMNSECATTAYSSEAALWGDITFAYINATPQNTVAHDDGAISGLDPNLSYWVELLTMTSGPSTSYTEASVDVYTW
jgi:hypothetical protein